MEHEVRRPSPVSLLVFLVLAGAPLGFVLLPPSAFRVPSDGIRVAMRGSQPDAAADFPRAVAPQAEYPCDTRRAVAAPAR